MAKVYKHLVIGGGILGASLASKLASSNISPQGQQSVCLIEGGTIASGTTSKSAGIIITKHKTQLGNLLATRTLDDVKNFCVTDSKDIFINIGTYNLSTKQQSTEDGFVDPYQLTRCYIKNAKRLGANIVENCPALNIQTVKGKDKQHHFLVNNDIHAENVYNTTGLWASCIASSGRPKKLPVAYMRSHYWEFNYENESRISKHVAQPILLMPGVYIKFQRHKFEVGIQEEMSFVVEDPIVDALPSEQESLHSLIDNYKILSEHIPNFKNATLKNYVCGISTYTADGLPIIDIEDQGIEGSGMFLTISGCNGYGVTWAGGISSIIAHQEKNIITKLDANRFWDLTQSQIVKRARDIRHKKMLRQ